jgi:hypothetical protein
VASPFSKPNAVDGYQGLINLEKRFDIASHFDCQLPIADFNLFASGKIGVATIRDEVG